MTLPQNSTQIVNEFKELDPKRKATIIDHLMAIPQAKKNEVITTFIKNGGAEGRFVAALFGKHPTGAGSAPANKSIDSMERK